MERAFLRNRPSPSARERAARLTCACRLNRIRRLAANSRPALGCRWRRFRQTRPARLLRHGTALDSGRRAGYAISEALQGRSVVLEDYRCWSSGLVKEFVHERRQRYQYEMLRKETPFWSNRRLVSF